MKYVLAAENKDYRFTGMNTEKYDFMFQKDDSGIIYKCRTVTELEIVDFNEIKNISNQI